MKTIFAVTILAATAATQNSLTSCLQGCSDRMRSASKAQELGCGSGDLKCLCNKDAFMYGFRDCADQACNKDDKEALLNMAKNICAEAGVAIANGNGGNGGASASAGNGGSSSHAGGASTVSGGGENENNSSAGAGGAVVTTFTSNGSEVVSTITSMSPGASAEATPTGSSEGNASTEGSEASSSGGNEHPSSTGSGNGASATNGGGAHSSSSSGLAGPQITAAPAAGLFAAAGIAALLI